MENKKTMTHLLCIDAAGFVFGVYLFAALRPGVWLRDAFLYRQADGSFSGKSITFQ